MTIDGMAGAAGAGPAGAAADVPAEPGMPAVPPAGDFPPPPPDWVPHYVAYPAPLPAPPGRRRRRLVIGGLATVWALVLLVTGVWYAFQGGHTVREQTTIAQAGPVVDGATAQVLRAAGPGAVAEISGYASAGGCDITPVRKGENWQRSVRLVTPADGEPGLLARIAGALPEGYKARVHHDGRATTLFADAGDYVAVNGAIEGPGLVRVVVSTGCRPLGHAPATDPTTEPSGPGHDRVLAVLGGYAVGAASWQSHELNCGTAGGGTVRTDSAVATGVPPQPLNQAEQPPGQPFVAATNLVATLEAGTATIARIANATLTVSVTTGACG